MKRIFFAAGTVSALALAACGTPAQQQQQVANVMLITAAAVPCAQASILAANKADTTANALAVASTFTSNAACQGVAGPTLNFIQTAIAAGAKDAAPAPAGAPPSVVPVASSPAPAAMPAAAPAK